MKKFGEYIIEGAPEGDKPDEVKPVKPGDPDYNLVMKMRAKYGIDPTGGKLDKKAIDQQALRRGTIKALGSKRFKRDMQDHTIASERLQRIDEALPLLAISGGAAVLGSLFSAYSGRKTAQQQARIQRSDAYRQGVMSGAGVQKRQGIMGGAPQNVATNPGLSISNLRSAGRSAFQGIANNLMSKYKGMVRK
jgi:hypothetical protein